MDTNISEQNVILILNMIPHNWDSMLLSNIGVEYPTQLHTSEVYSVKNYEFANIMWGCLRTNYCVKYLDKGKEMTLSEFIIGVTSLVHYHLVET
jgi:hypothetical protein